MRSCIVIGPLTFDRRAPIPATSQMSEWHLPSVPHHCIGKHMDHTVAQERRRPHMGLRLPRRFWGRSGFEGSCGQFFRRICGHSALDAIGNEGGTDESENIEGTSYGAGVVKAKESKMKKRLVNVSHKNGELEREIDDQRKLRNEINPIARREYTNEMSGYQSPGLA